MTVASSPEEMVGAVLARRYRLVSFIGSGPVGQVFEAHDLEEGNPCAVKTLRAGAGEPEDVIAAFLRDTRAARNIVHPNIAVCHDSGLAEDGAPYRIMELLDGSSLAAYLASGVAYDARHVLPIAASMVSAVREAHGRNLVHGDLKPTNVFMARNGTGAPTVKLLDFGMSGVLLRRRTSSFDGASAIDTLAFLSPEQRAGDEAEPRDDLWAIAVVLYRMLTGHAPVAVSGARMAAAAPSEPNLAYLGQAHLAGWRGFFGRAFAPEPSARFTSASEMQRELAVIEASVRDAPVTAPAASTTDLSPELPAFVSERSVPPQVDLLARVRAAGAISLEATMPGADAPVVPSPAPRPVSWKLVFAIALIILLSFAAGFAAARF